MDEVECEEWAAGGGLSAVFEALLRFALWFLHALGFALVFALVTWCCLQQDLQISSNRADPSSKPVCLQLEGRRHLDE